jgi:hypothetical protein
VTSLSLSAPHTDVVYVRAGVEMSRVQVPGYLLALNLPRSVEMHRESNEEVRLVESPDPLLECCGDIVLPWVNRAGPGVTTLTVPPPQPFQADDIRTMWQARNRLIASRRPPTSGEAEWSRLERIVGKDVDWTALEDAVKSAVSILASWPTQTVPTTAWLPVDRPGGRLLINMTERSSRTHRLPTGQSGAPAVTARRSAVLEKRTLHAVAAVSGLLAERLAGLAGLDQVPDLRDRLVGVFKQVASRSNPRRPVADPPPSVWPTAFTATYSACLRALSTIRDLGAGDGSAPLSEVWELYQAWVAEAIRSAMEGVLGPSMKTSGHKTCIGRWIDVQGEVELHYQPQIPARGAASFQGYGLVAAISDLDPDLLLIRTDAGGVRLIVVDAKKRSAAMLGEDLAGHSSKYLWGIRNSAAPEVVPSIQGAIMVAPLGGPSAALSAGLADTLTAHPEAGIEIRVAEVLLDLVRGVGLPPAAPHWHLPWK